MEAEDRADVVIVAVVGDFFFVVGVAEEHEEAPGETRGGFDDEGDVPFVAVVLVDILQVLAGVLHVPGKVVVGPVVNPFQLLPAHGEEVLDVVGVLGIVGQFIRTVAVPAEVVHFNAQFLVVGPAAFPPGVEPFFVGAGFYKELHFHLLKFAGAENKVFGNNFVPEGLADLGDAEGNFHPVGLDDVFIVYIDALGSFGAKINNTGAVLYGSDVGLEHEVKLAGVSELAAAFGAFFFGELFWVNLVRPETGFTLFAVHQWVGKVFHMARGFPNPGMHKDCRIKADDVVVELGHFLPPGLGDAIFKLYAQGAVIPGAGLAAVDFRRLKHKTTPLGEGRDFLHCCGTLIVVLLFSHEILLAPPVLPTARPPWCGGPWLCMVRRS